MATDPFYPVLVECIFAAQGLLHAGSGAMMTMLPETSTLPAAPRLRAEPDVIRAFGCVDVANSAGTANGPSIMTLVVGGL
jgi:hypothetical protein